MHEWMRCRAWLLAALDPGCASEAELLDDLSAGRAQLWVGEGAALVTQHAVDEVGPCAHIWLAGGDLKEILRLRPGIEAWARGQGCRRITIEGRKGWARVLRGHGYARAGHELERRL